VPVEASLEDLALAARDGDVDAFGRLVVATSPQVYALARRLVGNDDDAADVMQETYLRAFRAISAFRREAGVTTWLYRIAANCSATHLERRRRRRSEHLGDDVAIAEPRRERDPQAAADDGDDRRRLVAALGALPYELRAVVVLRDVYDLPHEAIAQELGISRAAARVRLHRARRRLRDALFGPVAAEARPAEGGGSVELLGRRRAPATRGRRAAG
jgi:RNA polymerase sigma-70 factor (ECF subfamily)